MEEASGSVQAACLRISALEGGVESRTDSTQPQLISSICCCLFRSGPKLAEFFKRTSVNLGFFPLSLGTECLSEWFCLHDMRALQGSG